MKTIITLLILGIFIVLWRLIGKYPESIVRMFPFIGQRVVENILHVFSAETSLGKESEFINERLPEKDKVIKFFYIFYNHYNFFNPIKMINIDLKRFTES
jgi:hypothetical protein